MAGSGRLSSRYAPKAPAIPPTSPRSAPATLLHLVALASLSWAFYDLTVPSEMTQVMDLSYGGRWAFLTVLSLVATWLTFVVALLKDAMPSVKIFDLLKTWLTILVVPVEGIVALLYWGLSAIDPTLLVPPGAKFQIPLVLDLGLHALPALFLWCDFLIFSPRMSDRANPLLVGAVATACYTGWMEYAAKINEEFPYPFLNSMSIISRLSLYVSCVAVLYGLFHTANGVHRLLRGDSHRQTQARKMR